MVYLHLPASYTEEEIMLQAKYDKLKRKKKALQVLKAPRQEPERTTPVKKPQIEARDAREIAKKLIKSGAIAAIKKTPKREEMSGFKRPGGVSKKPERPVISGFQPFAGNCDESRPSVKRLYKNEDEVSPPQPPPEVKQPKITGRCVFVKAHRINEGIIRKNFAEYGKIVDLKVEHEKGQAFVTFDSKQSAESCISSLNGSVLTESQVQMSVSYAKRQPPDIDMSSHSSPSCKRIEKDGKEQSHRQIVTYDDDIF